MLEPRGPGFMVEGPLSYKAFAGVRVDYLDIIDLIAQRLFGTEQEGAVARVRLTLEIIDD